MDACPSFFWQSPFGHLVYTNKCSSLFRQALPKNSDKVAGKKQVTCRHEGLVVAVKEWTSYNESWTGVLQLEWA